MKPARAVASGVDELRAARSDDEVPVADAVRHGEVREPADEVEHGIGRPQPIAEVGNQECGHEEAESCFGEEAEHDVVPIEKLGVRARQSVWPTKAPHSSSGLALAAACGQASPDTRCRQTRVR